MSPCNHYRDLLLDDLYGLLDASEVAAVEAHLAGCPACTSARIQAARDVGLIARAAKTEFPEVRFTPPVEVAPALGRSPHPLRPAWVQWAVAASVLALVPGTLTPLLARSSQFDRAKANADAAGAVSPMHETISTAPPPPAPASGLTPTPASPPPGSRPRRDPERLGGRRGRGRAGGTDRALAVAVTKPHAVQPGAPNDFVVSLRDKKGVLKGSRIEAEVRDEKGTLVHSEPLDPETRGDTHPVRLPAAAWTKVSPQSELFLVVARWTETGARTERPGTDPALRPGVRHPARHRQGRVPARRAAVLPLAHARPRLVPPAGPRAGAPLRCCARPTARRSARRSCGTTGTVRVADGKVEPVTGPDGTAGPRRRVRRVRAARRPARRRLRARAPRTAPAAAARRRPRRSRSRGR